VRDYFLPERLQLHLPTRRDVDVHYLLSGRAHDGVAGSEITEALPSVRIYCYQTPFWYIVPSQLSGASLRLRMRCRRHDDD
jgi:hypothetical protein